MYSYCFNSGNSEWYENFDVNRHAVHKNDKRSKILILTENEAEAEQECKTFKEKTTSNRVIWATFKIQKMDNGGYSNKTELLEKISEFRPSNIILDFAHENITDDNSLGHKDKFGNWVPKCVIPCNQAPTLGKLTMDLFNAHLLSEKYLQNYFLDFAKCAAAIATNVTASKNIVQTITIYQRVLSTVPVGQFFCVGLGSMFYLLCLDSCL